MTFLYGERLLIFVLLVAVTATAFVPNNVSPSAAASMTATDFRRMVVAKELSSNDEMKTVQEQLDELNQRHDELKERLDENDQRHDENDHLLDEIDQRLDGIVAAFEPATKFALMETAVYTFVRVSQQHEHLLPKIQDSASSVATCVLTLLLSEDDGPKSKSQFDWGQPNIKAFDAAARHGVGLEALGALVAFIENEHISKADLKDWQRNLVTQGGMFLDSLYDPGVREGGEPGKTAAQVKAMLESFVEKRISFQADIDVEAGLEKVVTVLAAKGLATSDPGKRDALQVLKRIFPPSVPVQSLTK
jgi:hypothetical protein